MPPEVLEPPPRPELPESEGRARGPKLKTIHDLVSFQKKIGINPKASELGYYEKPFRECEGNEKVGCPYRFFHLAQIRMQCRSTSGTVRNAVTAMELENLDYTRVKWKLGTQRGVTKTNANGQLRIRAIGGRSLLSQNIQLIANGNALSVALSSAKRLVLPNHWCR